MGLLLRQNLHYNLRFWGGISLHFLCFCYFSAFAIPPPRGSIKIRGYYGFSSCSQVNHGHCYWLLFSSSVCLHIFMRCTPWTSACILYEIQSSSVQRTLFKRGILMDKLPLRLSDSTCSRICVGMSSVYGGEVQGESPYSSLQYKVLRRQSLKPKARDVISLK